MADKIINTENDLTGIIYAATFCSTPGCNETVDGGSLCPVCFDIMFLEKD